MNKRYLIAWQLWIEKQPLSFSGRWQRVQRKIPVFVGDLFSEYISMRFMGVKLGLFRAVLSKVSFFVVCRIIFPIIK